MKMFTHPILMELIRNRDHRVRTGRARKAGTVRYTLADGSRSWVFHEFDDRTRRLHGVVHTPDGRTESMSIDMDRFVRIQSRFGTSPERDMQFLAS